jgi:hypothetical protein
MTHHRNLRRIRYDSLGTVSFGVNVAPGRETGST